MSGLLRIRQRTMRSKLIVGMRGSYDFYPNATQIDNKHKKRGINELHPPLLCKY